MIDPLISDIAQLHAKIHADDPKPADEQERQAEYIFSQYPNYARDRARLGATDDLF